VFRCAADIRERAPASIAARRPALPVSMHAVSLPAPTAQVMPNVALVNFWPGLRTLSSDSTHARPEVAKKNGTEAVIALADGGAGGLLSGRQTDLA
jgi:hypothetical protein